MNSPHKGPVTRKTFLFDDATMVKDLRVDVPLSFAVSHSVIWEAITTVPFLSLRHDMETFSALVALRNGQ